MKTFTWIVVWSTAAAVAVAAPPQFGGQPGRSAGTIDPAAVDEFAPVNQRGRSNSPPPRRASGSTPVQNDPAALGAAAANAGAPVVQEADPLAGGNAARPAMSGPNRMFLAIDANNDGIINAQELRRAAASLKILDADNDGNITLAEVGASQGAAGAGAMAPTVGGNPLVDQTIAQNDKNGDGQLTPNEMPPQAARMFPQMDANGDGILTRDELNMAAVSMANQFGMMGGFPGGMNNNAGGGAQGLMQYDRNRDGRLTADEVPPQLAGMLQAADQNRDGAIDMRELAAFAQMGQQMGGNGFGRGGGGEFPPGDGRGPRRGQ